MKNLFLLLIIIGFTQCNTSTNNTIATPGKYVVKNVSVIAMDTDKVLPLQDVFIANGTITNIGNTGAQEADTDAFIIDGTGKYLIPGFAEMHAHVPGTNDTAVAKQVLELYVLNGVT